MAAFEYTALDPAGRKVKGVLEADSNRQIRQLLRDQGLVPLDVDAASESSRAQPGQGFSFGRRLSALDLVLFTRQVATLIAASLPIEEALKAVADQAEKRSVGSLVMAVRSRVLEGFSLAAAMAEFPSSFSQMYRSTIAAGEHSGFLDRVMENLADYTERRFESARSMQMALFYPVALLLIAMGIVGGMMIYVVPQMVGVFENIGQDLPASTVFLIAVSDFLRSYWWALLGGVVLLIWGTRRLLQQPAVRLGWDLRVFALAVRPERSYAVTMPPATPIR